MEACLFCGSIKEAGRVDKGCDFICGSCVALLLQAKQDDLQRAYDKCIRMNLHGKARAIETFLEEIRYDGNTNSERGSVDSRAINDGNRTGESVRVSSCDRETSSVRGKDSLRPDREGPNYLPGGVDPPLAKIERGLGE